MKAKILIIVCLLSLLTACTSLNKECDNFTFAKDDCWPDVNKCGYPKTQKYLERCKYSNWHCGYYYDFGDP
jgi:hypothetical protein